VSSITARSRIERYLLVAVWVLLLVHAGAYSAVHAAKGPLVPRPLAARKGEAPWEAPQFFQADRKGRISILRPSTLEVFPLGENDRLGEAVKLKANALGRSGPLIDGAMSADGDWLVREGPRARLFRGGKEVTLEDSGWYLAGLGWLRGDPLLSVEPARTVPGPQPKGPPPLVLRWTGRAWETLLTDVSLPGIDEPLDPTARAYRQVELLGDSKGTLWAANTYRYLVRRFSPSGKLKLKIAVGKGEVQQRKDASAAQKTFAREVGKSGLARQKGAVIQAATAVPVTDALAEGRDGKMYFLVHQGWEGGDFALDRYDTVRSILERVPLRLQNVGVMSMASGKDGLYIAAFSAQRGRWKILWGDIDAAAWKPVNGAKIDDLAQGPDEP
jgi:hypothetical protein